MKIGKIILIVLISTFIWGISLYNGWLNEAVLFGRNTFYRWINENNSQILLDNNATTVKKDKFAYMLLTDITIPSNITTIENGAFSKGNKLISITIGSNVSLERDAFGYSFESVYNNNNKEAGTFTRDNHKSTEWIIWYDDFSYRNHNGNITITGYKATGTANIPDKIHDNSVTVISDNAFRNKGLNSVTIPASVVSIGENAFRDNELSGITIPDNVTSIGNAAFYKNQLTRISIPNKVRSIGINAFAENYIIRVSIGENVSLGSDKDNGVLGGKTGFNTAYTNNKNMAGVYTRLNIGSTTWTRTSRASVAQTEKLISSIDSKWSNNRVTLGTPSWNVHVQELNEPIIDCIRFTLDHEFRKINSGDPYGTQDVYVRGIDGSWSKVGSFNVPNNKKVTTIIRLSSPANINEVGIVPAKSASGQTSYERWFAVRNFIVNR